MNDTPPPRKVGRPATGRTKVKLSASVNRQLVEAATREAYSKGESLSQWVSRAMQSQLLKS